MAIQPPGQRACLARRLRMRTTCDANHLPPSGVSTFRLLSSAAVLRRRQVLERRHAEISARLALTRRALTLTRFQMARLLGIDVPTWGTYEAGLQRRAP